MSEREPSYFIFNATHVYYNIYYFNIANAILVRPRLQRGRGGGCATATRVMCSLNLLLFVLLCQLRNCRQNLSSSYHNFEAYL